MSQRLKRRFLHMAGANPHDSSPQRSRISSGGQLLKTPVKSYSAAFGSAYWHRRFVLSPCSRGSLMRSNTTSGSSDEKQSASDDLAAFLSLGDKQSAGLLVGSSYIPQPGAFAQEACAEEVKAKRGSGLEAMPWT